MHGADFQKLEGKKNATGMALCLLFRAYMPYFILILLHVLQSTTYILLLHHTGTDTHLQQRRTARLMTFLANNRRV